MDRVSLMWSKTVGFVSRLVLCELVQLMKQLDVMNELCPLPSCGSKHTMVKVSGHICLPKKGDEMRSLPHEGSRKTKECGVVGKEGSIYR